MATATQALHTGKAVLHSTKPHRMGHYCAERAVETPATQSLLAGPVIASVSSRAAFEQSLFAPTGTIFLHMGDPMELPGMLAAAARHSKSIMLNLDFMEGLSRDRSAVRFLASLGVEAVSSTRTDSLRAAKEQGMVTVQRTFAIDTASVEAARRSIENFQPDGLEILPAPAAPRVCELLRESAPAVKFLAGGLVQNVREMEALLAAGVTAVTTSNTRLWVI